MLRILSLVAILGLFAVSMTGCRAEVEPTHASSVTAPR